MEKTAEHARTGDLNFFSNLDAETLKKYLKRTDEDGRTLLHSACLSNSLPLVQYLSEKDPSIDVDNKDDEGWTALHSASSCGFDSIVQFLLEKLHANPNIATSSGRTPIMYTASKGHVNVLRLLLAHGAQVGAVDMTGSTALHRAASVGRVEAARVLVEEGRAPLDPQDAAGDTPLMIAITCDQSRMAFFLSTKGASLEIRNKEGATPLSAAGENAPALKRAAAGATSMETDN